ncbi:hypothetical protein [Streptomyces cucumeris]|uniref:hypothetical protein n=1 Tax=Streptomyces cucumeris TaxID=2962890 RepID=UPI003D748D11
MTACAFDAAVAVGVSTRRREGSARGSAPDGAARERFTVAADGSYGARLAFQPETRCWYPERWTLDGPEPYAVPLPGAQPEEPDSELLPLADGQVLIHRRVAGHHAFSLLYPAGPGTGERLLGALDRADVSLLPPAPGGLSVFALARGEHSTSVWLVHGGLVPQHLAEVPGRCTGGSWLDRTGRLLALDRELDGRTKTVVVDLGRGGETSPLLQITERSNDRLLLADPDSGLLLVRSDAPGDERLGWGVLGSARPVRFPDCLRPAARSEATPFAVQPGQVLTPESCAVAFRIDGPAGRPWVGVWRPAERRLRQFSAPEGWLPGAGLMTRDGALLLPYTTRQVACGVARVWLPDLEGGAGLPGADTLGGLDLTGAAGEPPRAAGPPRPRPLPRRTAELPRTGEIHRVSDPRRRLQLPPPPPAPAAERLMEAPDTGESPGATETPRVAAMPRAGETRPARQVPGAVEVPRPGEPFRGDATSGSGEPGRTAELMPPGAMPDPAPEARAGELPRAIETPRGGATSRPAEPTPRMAALPRAGEFPRSAELPRVGETGHTGQAPGAGETPRRGEVPGAVAFAPPGEPGRTAELTYPGPMPEAVSAPRARELPRAVEAPRTGQTSRPAEATPSVTESPRAGEARHAGQVPGAGGFARPGEPGRAAELMPPGAMPDAAGMPQTGGTPRAAELPRAAGAHRAGEPSPAGAAQGAAELPRAGGASGVVAAEPPRPGEAPRAAETYRAGRAPGAGEVPRPVEEGRAGHGSAVSPRTGEIRRIAELRRTAGVARAGEASPAAVLPGVGAASPAAVIPRVGEVRTAVLPRVAEARPAGGLAVAAATAAPGAARVVRRVVGRGVEPAVTGLAAIPEPARITPWTRVKGEDRAVVSGVEPWGGTGSWAGVEQTGPEPDPGSDTLDMQRPVPLQQAPLARPLQPRPPRWVRDQHPG